MKALRVISRIIVGLVFVFSGFVKAVDPLGSAYKFHDYFQAFHLDFMQQFSLPLAILLCTFEFIAGFSVLAGLVPRAGEWLVLILMVIFTPLTLVLAISNPVSDCGCFGDALKLTNWQTFGKNVVLIAFTIVLFASGRKQASRTGGLIKIGLLFGISVLFILFSLYNIRYLPVIDFLPYSKGSSIPAKMQIPPGAAANVYNTTFIYEKDGQKKEFTLQNYPADDSTWKFVDQKSVLVKKGYMPPIHDFSIRTTDGTDLTAQILDDNKYVLMMISRKLEETDARRLEAGFDLGRSCTETGTGFYILTSSGSEVINRFNNGLNFCLTDETTLKTMVRSDPGYILLRKGVIEGKWSWANVPEKDWFTALGSGD